MYCKHCASEMDPNAAVCLHCGYAAGRGEDFCPNCGQKFECIVDEDDLRALDGDEGNGDKE